MVRRISFQSLATTLIAVLLTIAIAYYIFPGHDSFFILVGSIVGAGPLLIMAIIVIAGIIILMVKPIIRYVKNNIIQR